jgi:formate dehydrogenase assembly factor FdhD
MEMNEEREKCQKAGSGEVTAKVVLVPVCPQAAGDDADAAWNAHACTGGRTIWQATECTHAARLCTPDGMIRTPIEPNLSLAHC